MMRLTAVPIVLLTFAAAASAQSSNGYVFFAPGGATASGHTVMTLHMGLGGEGILGKGVGIGAEIGALGPRERFGDGVLGVFSPNGYFHFVHDRKAKADPFVTGGYTLIFRSGHANLFNFGGGANYWFRSKLGLRFEMRDHVWKESCCTLHYWGFRIGLAFR